jgi:hypothetical protein
VWSGRGDDHIFAGALTIIAGGVLFTNRAPPKGARFLWPDAFLALYPDTIDGTLRSSESDSHGVASAVRAAADRAVHRLIAARG